MSESVNKKGKNRQSDLSKTRKKDLVNEGNHPIGIGIREVVRETILGFLFWSLFQALAPMIWFYPLNELDITGYEAFAVVLFSPIIVGMPPIRRSLQNRWVVALLRLLMLASVMSLQAETTLQRLLILAGGCFVTMLVFTANFWSSSSYQRTLSFWGLMLGLFTFLSSRIWFTTFVPTWWDKKANNMVIALGAIATLDKLVSGDDGATGHPIKPVFKPNWFCTALGFGSLIFLTQWVFGEVSLVTRWTVTGYPETGPMPFPWGIAVLLALWFGLVLAPCKHVTNSFVWFATGALSLSALYYAHPWSAFLGGVILAVFTMSIWPEMIDRLTACPPARTVVLAMLVWLIEILFLVWTVAYNFVPGGVYTREHTDWLIAAVMTCIGLALHSKSRTDEKSNTAFVDIGGKMPNRTIRLALYVIVLVGLGGFATRFNKQTFNHPPKVHPKADFSAAIWTYHFGYDNYGWQSLERSAALLKDTGADVITLLESDASKPFLGNNDLGMWLGEELGMYVDFGPATKDHTWGNLILSKYPFVNSTHHLLPSPHGELAPAVTATINMTGHLVDFVVTHMGNDRDVLDRKLQAEFLSNQLSNAQNPVVFLGYVTSAPFSREYVQLTTEGRTKDIDETDDDRWCEYIMYRGLIRQGYARISHGGLSDTEVQIGKFRIPENPESYSDNDKVTTDPDKVEEDMRFTSKFGKLRHGHNWVWKHSYHMGTPKYFIQG